MNLFVKETFTGHSGDELHWKIECDALSEKDWDCLAYMASTLMPSFSRAVGVPTGGIPFADALNRYADENAQMWLIVDDVWTTGGSIAEFKSQFSAEELEKSITLVAFNRSSLGLPWKTYCVLDIHPRVAP